MKYVIIGNSAAGIGAVEGIRQTEQSSKALPGEITIISDEPHHTYSRPLISYLLLGKVTEEKMKYRPDSFYSEYHCEFLHARVTSINAKAKQVFLENGNKIPYDKLLVATGSSAFVPPFAGLDTVEHKFTFMSLDDARKIDAVLAKDKKVLIIGAGLIGLKCAEGILNREASITVLDLAPRILSSILDDEGAQIVQTHLENVSRSSSGTQGINFRLSASVKRFEKNTAILESGEDIPFDILILAVGVRPNTSLLKGIAEIDRGIVINQRSETTAPDIYAAGDCTQTLDISSGQKKIMALLPNAYMQGECAGINMAGGAMDALANGRFDKAIPMNAIGFCGLHIITAGNYTGDVFTENANGNYKRLFYSDNKLNGYILIGNVDKAGIYTNLIRECTPLDTLDFALVCKKPGLMAFSKEERMIKLGSEPSSPAGRIKR